MSDITVTPEEQESMILILTKISCSNQALNQLPTLEGGYTREELILYIHGAIDNLAEARFLERIWWLDIAKKYNLQGPHTFDPDTGILRAQGV
jgi:hypothetical protein